MAYFGSPDDFDDLEAALEQVLIRTAAWLLQTEMCATQ